MSAVVPKFKIGDTAYVPRDEAIYECEIKKIRKDFLGCFINAAKAKNSYRTFYGDETVTLTKEEAEVVQRRRDCLS